MYPRNSPLTDETIADLLGLAGLRIGRHPSESQNHPGDGDLWVQSIWRARVLPTFDADAFLAVVTCAKPWQTAADPRPGLWARCTHFIGRSPSPLSVSWRKAVISLQGQPTVIELPNDPVADALRQVDLFETYEHGSMDGISYSIDIETWSARARLTFGNPEVPSLRRLARSLLAVGREVGRISGIGRVNEYVKVWSRYVE